MNDGLPDSLEDVYSDHFDEYLLLQARTGRLRLRGPWPTVREERRHSITAEDVDLSHGPEDSCGHHLPGNVSRQSRLTSGQPGQHRRRLTSVEDDDQSEGTEATVRRHLADSSLLQASTNKVRASTCPTEVPKFRYASGLLDYICLPTDVQETITDADLSLTVWANCACFLIGTYPQEAMDVNNCVDLSAFLPTARGSNASNAFSQIAVRGFIFLMHCGKPLSDANVAFTQKRWEAATVNSFDTKCSPGVVLELTKLFLSRYADLLSVPVRHAFCRAVVEHYFKSTEPDLMDQIMVVYTSYGMTMINLARNFLTARMTAAHLLKQVIDEALEFVVTYQEYKMKYKGMLKFAYVIGLDINKLNPKKYPLLMEATRWWAIKRNLLPNDASLVFNGVPLSEPQERVKHLISLEMSGNQTLVQYLQNLKGITLSQRLPDLILQRPTHNRRYASKDSEVFVKDCTEGGQFPSGVLTEACSSKSCNKRAVSPGTTSAQKQMRTKSKQVKCTGGASTMAQTTPFMLLPDDLNNRSKASVSEASPPAPVGKQSRADILMSMTAEEKDKLDPAYLVFHAVLALSEVTQVAVDKLDNIAGAMEGLRKDVAGVLHDRQTEIPRQQTGDLQKEQSSNTGLPSI